MIDILQYPPCLSAQGFVYTPDLGSIRVLLTAEWLGTNLVNSHERVNLPFTKLSSLRKKRKSNEIWTRITDLLDKRFFDKR